MHLRVAAILLISSQAHAGNIARALTMYEQLYQGDPDNTGYGKALKQLRALVSGREAGNAAFKEGRYQQAYDECAASRSPAVMLRVPT